MMKKILILILFTCNMFAVDCTKTPNDPACVATKSKNGTKKTQPIVAKKAPQAAPKVKAKKESMPVAPAPTAPVATAPTQAPAPAPALTAACPPIQTSTPAPRWCPQPATQTNKSGSFSPVLVPGTSIYCFQETTDGDFTTYLSNVTKKSSSGVVVVDFNGEGWCFYSEAFKLVFDDTVKNYPNVQFIKVHTDRKFIENTNTLGQYNVCFVPEAIFFKNNQKVLTYAATNSKDFAKLIDCVISQNGPICVANTNIPGAPCTVDPSVPDDCSQVLSTQPFQKNSPVDLSKQVLVTGAKKDITKF